MNDGGGGGDCFPSNFRAITRLETLATQAMADPDLQIRVGGGEGHPDPVIGGTQFQKKKFFLALRASVWPKNKNAGPSPGSANATQ